VTRYGFTIPAHVAAGSYRVYIVYTYDDFNIGIHFVGELMVLDDAP